VDLFRFLREAIEGREYAKFVFTKSVSEVLRLVKEIGAQYGFSADDMSYVNITTLLNLYSVLDHRDFVEILGQEIGNNKTFYHHNKFIRMPQIIIEPEDIYCFELVSGLPNFIGTRKVRADVLPEDQFETQDLSGKVVFIESADPGYDWIFSRNIGGLVTMYGGANSHMAIRSAELNITAVIGAGEKNFKEWVLARTLEIDPVNKLVHSVK
ncbi:MAG: phosphoenolpyruvate synthase, partial [Candidatus Omnitrophica bacterium]|nr:phosphoenolpyruvate synthase [Candidatus Omnitrophota bacterium]